MSNGRCFVSLLYRYGRNFAVKLLIGGMLTELP